jgi:NADPH-dependent 2,4-dienoyl-CoA reductase/sulfur reductase-like enzyme
VKRIVVIGGSAAGMMAAISAAKQDPTAEVTVVTGDRIPYRRPAIPALIAGYITTPAGAKVFSPETLARYNIKLICPAEATNIDPKSKAISILFNGKEEKLVYDAAVLAAGASPLIPKIPGSDKKGVCTFTTYEAAAEIVETVSGERSRTAKNADSAVVIGAGFIALEIAEALMHKGLDVYFNVRSRILRKLLEPEVSDFLTKKFERQGLKMLTGEEISEIGGADRVEYVLHKGGKIAANLVVVGTGVKPSIALAEKCGIELGQTGAIKVDNYLQTSIKNIYAAGDCAESPDLGTGRFIYSPVGSIGASAGKIAGANAAGAKEKTKGFLRAQADQILGLQIFSIGHSTTSAEELGLKVKVHNLSVPQSAIKNRTTDSFEVAKILTGPRDRIVGAQLVARKHGSQFAWQLYKAVLQSEDRKEFLQRFNSPRTRLAEALVHALKSTIRVNSIGEDKALTLTDALAE